MEHYDSNASWFLNACMLFFHNAITFLAQFHFLKPTPRDTNMLSDSNSHFFHNCKIWQNSSHNIYVSFLENHTLHFQNIKFTSLVIFTSNNAKEVNINVVQPRAMTDLSSFTHFLRPEILNVPFSFHRRVYHHQKKEPHPERPKKNKTIHSLKKLPLLK